ncbi:MAG: sterol desaturase family protein, partial [Planctomycetota bacterium]
MIIILYAIPVFMATIVLEAAWAWFKQGNLTADACGRTRPIYQFADAVGSLQIGILSRIAAVFPKLLTLVIYSLVFEQLQVGAWDLKNPVAWGAALIMYDFFYYWKHRANHEVRIMWAGHITHHNSEFFNLSTALRQSSTTFIFDWIFYLPMAVVGVPPAMFVGVALIDLL